MSDSINGGATNVTTYFQLRNVADGTDATGKTIADFDLQYVRTGATPVAKVDAVALAAANTAHTDNRMIEVDATDTPGLYRVDWPDAAFVAGVREAVLTVKHADIQTASLRASIDPPVNLDVINTDTNAEPAAGLPPNAPTLIQMANYIYRRLIKDVTDFNKDTGVERVLMNDGTTLRHQRTVTDNNVTTTKGATTA